MTNHPTKYIQLDQIAKDVAAVSSMPISQSLLDVVCSITGMGFAAIARVTEDRWVACSVSDRINFGMKPGGELEVGTTICNEIRESRQLVVFDNADEDPQFNCHHTPRQYGLKSYISVPIIRRDGSFFGTLCAIDPRPAKLNNPETIGMFQLFADLISFHLSTVDTLTLAETELLEEQKISSLRDKFIAVLGHDLRNPLGAISTSAQLLKRMALPGDASRLVSIVQDSSGRMKELIDNLLDFAMGRLGGGIVLARTSVSDLERTLTEVINELRIKWNEPVILTNFELMEPVICDSKRISQLLSNLLGNALSYGKQGTPISIHVSSVGGKFKLSITNEGPSIPEPVMAQMFKPFARGDQNEHQPGLGLGLYIVREIADAHRGEMEVQSGDNKTTFTFRMQSNRELEAR